MKIHDAAHALAAALQNTLDAYGDLMDMETLVEGQKALAEYGLVVLSDSGDGRISALLQSSSQAC